MKPHHLETESTQGVDDTLTLLSRVQPRDGLEQRVLARIAAAPALPWYRRLWVAPGMQPSMQYRWMLAAASAVIVAGAVTLGVSHDRAGFAPPAPMATHVPHPAYQAAAAAAAVAVPSHHLQSTTARTHHRGVRRSYRATHQRVPLPPGTVAPRVLHVPTGTP